MECIRTRTRSSKDTDLDGDDLGGFFRLADDPFTGVRNDDGSACSECAEDIVDREVEAQ